jgi:xylulokinase
MEHVSAGTAHMLIGIDIGQGAIKATALDHAGIVLGTASEELRTYYPAPGRAEQNPRDWIDAAGRACRSLLEQVSAATEIEGVGLSAATHHAVLLDGHDRPLRPCIMLTDGRAAEHGRRLMAEHGATILARARNAATAGWVLPQLRWIAELEPDIWTQVARITFAKDYLRLALTGQWSTDAIDAEGSLLYNPFEGRWDPVLCDLVPLPPAWLPPAVSPTAVTGKITREGERLTGIPAGTPVVGGCSDTAAEAYAAGACAEGQVVVKMATAGNVNLVTANPRPRPEWFTYSHPIPGLSYHAIGTNSAASSQRWFRDVVTGGADDLSYATLDEEAARVPPGCEGVLFHPYLLGERAPYWDPDLRASFIGLRAEHGRGHMARAVLEGVALSLADCLTVFQTHGIAVVSARIVGGGARSVLWRQIMADVLGIPLQYPSLSDASAGAALLAGVGVGIYASAEEAPARTVQIVAEAIPDVGLHQSYVELLAIYQGTQRQLAPISRALGRVRFPLA